MIACIERCTNKVLRGGVGITMTHRQFCGWQSGTWKIKGQ